MRVARCVDSASRQAVAQVKREVCASVMVVFCMMPRVRKMRQPRRWQAGCLMSPGVAWGCRVILMPDGDAASVRQSASGSAPALMSAQRFYFRLMMLDASPPRAVRVICAKR